MLYGVSLTDAYRVLARNTSALPTSAVATFCGYADSRKRMNRTRKMPLQTIEKTKACRPKQLLVSWKYMNGRLSTKETENWTICPFVMYFCE